MYDKNVIKPVSLRKENKLTELETRLSELEDEFAYMKRMYADMLRELGDKYTGTPIAGA